MELRDVTSDNWRGVVRIEPREDQRRFVASVAYYLNLCHYGEDWRPLALYTDDEPVGFAMWAFDTEEESYWIGGLVIGAEHQGKGYGRRWRRCSTISPRNPDTGRPHSPVIPRTPSPGDCMLASGSSRRANG